MSNREFQVTRTPSSSQTARRQNPTTPFEISKKRLRYSGPRSAPSSRNSADVRPGSARGVLRRLAKLTAATTQRRVVTPKDVSSAKENLLPQRSNDQDEDIKIPKFALNVEASLEEDDSEILVAPTPSALFQHSDDEDDPQPTLTFLKERSQLAHESSSRIQTRVSLISQSDSAIPDEDVDVESESDGEGGNSTFLTERGRRAISEEPTRMSRYSFGSIRMSDFGSELEIRRQSDRQKKLAELEAQDVYEYDDGIDEHNMIQLGGETENLRNLQRSPSISSDHVEETLHMPGTADDSFQLEVLGELELIEHDDASGHQRVQPVRGPVTADSILEVNEFEREDQEEDLQEVAPPSDRGSRRQTLLESVAAAVSKPRPRKKLKMNRKGNMVQSFPSSLIKRIVNESQEKAGRRKLALGKDHMKALEQATEWFFEQAGEDLERYSDHSKRKKRIDRSDVLLLMRRQRVLLRSGELQEMAKQWLPREILNDLDFGDEP